MTDKAMIVEYGIKMKITSKICIAVLATLLFSTAVVFAESDDPHILKAQDTLYAEEEDDFEVYISAEEYYNTCLKKLDPERYDGLLFDDFFESPNNIEEYKKIYTLANEIISGCMTDESRARAIHDWIGKNVAYDFYRNAIDPDDKWFYMDTLEKGAAVCAGYADLNMLMLRAVGIPAIYVDGDGHAFNAVYWDDKWHYIDVTGDSPNKYYGEGDPRNILNQPPVYTYFDIPPEKLKGKSHTTTIHQGLLEQMVDIDHILIEWNKDEYNTQPKTVFNRDDKFTFANGIINVFNENSNDIERIYFDDDDFVFFTLSGYDMSKLGKQSVTVTLGIPGISTFQTEYTIEVRLPKVQIDKLSAKKKAITVKWGKRENVTGYEIQCGLKKNFKGAKRVTVANEDVTSKKISKLKAKKKYYVRIRAYKVENGTKYYSAWSTKKAIKTK